ncbi:hypothetical protein BJX63DRAFT_428126 [Aspergillus granulosus]|uniref:Uncharacterized protein n=1 Tax=Aspergillus granulosus TaxID=176169 RepID=A0ABR4HXS0_9EURO
MQLLKTLTLISLATGTTFAYKIRAWSGNGCTGTPQEINIYDNTCRTTSVPAMKSFRVISYGAGRQRATFWTGAGCSPFWTDARQSYWADGGSDKFKKDACITLGWQPKALGSVSA